MNARNVEAARLLAEIVQRAAGAMADLAKRGELDSIQVMHVRGIADQAAHVASLFAPSSKPAGEV